MERRKRDTAIIEVIELFSSTYAARPRIGSFSYNDDPANGTNNVCEIGLEIAESRKQTISKPAPYLHIEHPTSQSPFLQARLLRFPWPMSNLTLSDGMRDSTNKETE